MAQHFDSNGVSRRDFVKSLNATTLGALAAGYPRQLLAAAFRG